MEKSTDELIKWIDGRIETAEKHKKDLLEKREQFIDSDHLLATKFGIFAHGMQSRIQAFRNVKRYLRYGN